MPYETRACAWCFGTGRYPHAEKATERPVVVTCGRCEGSGRVTVYLYPRLRKGARA